MGIKFAGDVRWQDDRKRDMRERGRSDVSEPIATPAGQASLSFLPKGPSLLLNMRYHFFSSSEWNKRRIRSRIYEDMTRFEKNLREN